MASYALGVAIIVLVMVAWVGVQLAWKRCFPGVWADPDALAGRMGCHGCEYQEKTGGDPTCCDMATAPRGSEQCRERCNIPGSIEEESR